ncbi:MAG TPA: adenylate/guanylate cyclase domain-containing protein [Solirubrobacteraceae bacterium]
MSPPGAQRRTWRLISATRELNRHPNLVGAAKRARERLLGDDRFADRLSTARGRPADLAVRELAAYRSDEPGLVGELALTALQGWQKLAEHQGRGRGDVEVAILFTDLVGFSAWALAAGDEPAITLLRAVADAIEPPILERRGEVVKRLGDGLMAAFWDASTAADAAFEARERAGSIEIEGYRATLRTGIHLGRPRKIGGDYLGVDVNIAARLVEAAAPGEVLVSDRTLDALTTAESASERRVSAAGAPADLLAHAVRPRQP